MKKVISLIMAVILLAGLSACGIIDRLTGRIPNVPSASETPVSSDQSQTSGQSQTPPSDPTAQNPPVQPSEVPAYRVESIAMSIEYSEQGQCIGYIKAFDANRSVVWEYTTNWCDVAQCDVIQEIGLGPDSSGYIFIEDGSICCLDRESGEIIWKNDAFLGSGACWDFDANGNLYLTGYFSPWLFVIGPDGNTVAEYRDMPADYEEFGYYWPAYLSIDGDGMVNIKYDSNDRVLVIDSANGTIVDEYFYAEVIDPAFLVGEWGDNDSEPSVLMRIYADLKFEISLHVDDHTTYHYEGWFDLDKLNGEHSLGLDWLRSNLTYTDDPNIQQSQSVGDFVITYSSRESWTNDCIWLSQVNNGDSFLSVNLQTFGMVLYRITGPLG